MKRYASALLVAAWMGTFALAAQAQAAVAPTPQAVAIHYADLAEAIYDDSLVSARDLQKSVDAFLRTPTPETMSAARAFWKKARIPYLQSEGFRFANSVVDAWEPRVNAWPLDEGLIDYVAPAYGKQSDQNPLYTLNLVANTRLRVGAKIVDATNIDAALLRQLQEAEGVQTNVSTGYHAIEFLLWGQDLKGLSGGAGERPATDYDALTPLILESKDGGDTARDWRHWDCRSLSVSLQSCDARRDKFGCVV
jgi:putative iron-regulated protein